MSKEDNKFPVLGKTGSVKFVKWDLLNEQQAMSNHSQTLTRLAARGGLCWEELYCNYYLLPLDHVYKIDKKLYKEMVDTIK